MPLASEGLKPLPQPIEGQADTGILYIPETMKNWPWQRAINVYYEEVSKESNAWIKSFKPFNDRSQHAYDLCDFGRLAALVYPNASKEQLRTGVDLMNVFFVVDEYTDVEPQPVVEEMINIVIDAIRNPTKPRPAGETVLGEIARQFWKRGEKTATASAAKHFVEAFIDYLRSVVIQAGDRDDNKIRTVEEYLHTRRQNIGARPSYAVGELSLNIPDYAFYHPAVKELEYLIADLLILDNDIVSYNKEQAVGDDRHNILTVVMHQHNLSLASAISWVARYHEEVEARFHDRLKQIPSWGREIDERVAVYIEHIAGWPRGSDCWNFESGRYFGSEGHEVQKTRVVSLLRKKERVTAHHMKDVEIPIIDSLRAGVSK